MKVKEKQMSKNKIELQDTYAYGFHDQDVSVYRTRKGLDAQVVETISRIKQEPDWMRELRLKDCSAYNVGDEVKDAVFAAGY